MIYLASSWRNPHHTEALAQLRAAGREVYDFKNPAPSDNGFGWRQVTPEPKPWSLEKLAEVLTHPIAQKGFGHDFGAMNACDACVMLLPCGRSAHIEAGWFAGRGLPVVVWGFPGDLHEPELMYLMTAGVATSVADVLAKLVPACPNCGHTEYHCPSSGCNHAEPGPTLSDGGDGGTNWCDCESTEPGTRIGLRLIGGAP